MEEMDDDVKIKVCKFVTGDVVRQLHISKLQFFEEFDEEPTYMYINTKTYSTIYQSILESNDELVEGDEFKEFLGLYVCVDDNIYGNDYILCDCEIENVSFDQLTIHTYQSDLLDRLNIPSPHLN